MLEKFEIFKMFPVPLYLTNIGVENYNLNEIHKEEYVRMKSENGYYTKDKHILDKQLYNNLKNKINDHLNFFLKQQLFTTNDLTFYITTSWINIHKKEDWAQTHSHENSIISGVYYIETTEISGDIIFYVDTCRKLFSPVININFNQRNDLNTDEWIIKPKSGSLILFPSYLSHGVKKNMSENDRISLAFNVFVKGKLSDKTEGELKLK
jgi:uncharacterized protein (TIGR02466 family)